MSSHSESIAEPMSRVLILDRYPNRPHNHSNTFAFHDLYLTLFNPLNDARKTIVGPPKARRIGPATRQTPHEARQNIIERFISRWRHEVGNDIYPVFRLILPEKDRERPMYHLKEASIARLLIQTMRINKDSEDAQNLLKWKQPGQSASKMAGDFAGRCHEVISKRPMMSQPGNMTIDEVNCLLDELAAVDKKEVGQLPIIKMFYNRMNADELMWLIRILLRAMKVGATENTFFSIWHPDALGLFNISSSLRRVCWELYDPTLRLESGHRSITPMQCFQPQLASFNMRSIPKMVDKMRSTEDDLSFWIEEKLDGERMQLHMVSDEDTPGGKRFGFWSRKAKDYTNLYGTGFHDSNSALSRHLKNAFHSGVDNIILDGEMITWDPEQDAIVPFGSLKTAVGIQQSNPYSQGWRPVFKVFDILYLNDVVLTHYTLRDRRNALTGAVLGAQQRLEIHAYKETDKTDDVEPALRQVVAEGSEGLVLKNPRSAYTLNERNENWIKVKPEYMTEFGENLDCCIVAGYYGSGRRGGILSSFLCGLRVDQSQVQQGADPMMFYSFFKVGGGFTASDYKTIFHHTDGKWKTWDRHRPPSRYIALGGANDRQYEIPDEWILPSDSLVIEAKAAAVTTTDQFKMGFTLRFPRFKRIRKDRDWKNALSISGFMQLKSEAEQEQKEHELVIDESRKKRPRLTQRKPITMMGEQVLSGQPLLRKSTNVFNGLQFCILTGVDTPERWSRSELEQLVKTHGGKVWANVTRAGCMCIGDSRQLKVVSVMKSGIVDIIRPSWILDNISQNELDGDRPNVILPLEPRYMFHTRFNSDAHDQENVDSFGDSFTRDVGILELKEILAAISYETKEGKRTTRLKSELLDDPSGLHSLRGWMFTNLTLYPDIGQPSEPEPPACNVLQWCNVARFAGARLVDVLQEGTTHVVIGSDRSRLSSLRKQMSTLRRLPRIVTFGWIEQSWAEGTLLDEERFNSS